MPTASPIATLLATATREAEDEQQTVTRKTARADWVRERVAALRAAQRQMDDRCTKSVDRLDEEEFQHLFDTEQAKVTAIRAELDEVAERDRWPKRLYWSL